MENAPKLKVWVGAQIIHKTIEDSLCDSLTPL